MSLRAPAWSEAASRNERGSPGSEQRGSSTAHAHGWFGLYECNYGQNQELQFIGEDMSTYIDMSAFPSDSSGEKLVFQPKSCVGKDNCTPPDRDEIVGTSEWPWPEFNLV